MQQIVQPHQKIQKDDVQIYLYSESHRANFLLRIQLNHLVFSAQMAYTASDHIQDNLKNQNTYDNLNGHLYGIHLFPQVLHWPIRYATIPENHRQPPLSEPHHHGVYDVKKLLLRSINPLHLLHRFLNPHHESIGKS